MANDVYIKEQDCRYVRMVVDMVKQRQLLPIVLLYTSPVYLYNYTRTFTKSKARWRVLVVIRNQYSNLTKVPIIFITNSMTAAHMFCKLLVTNIDIQSNLLTIMSLNLSQDGSWPFEVLLKQTTSSRLISTANERSILTMQSYLTTTTAQIYVRSTNYM